jgi:LPXTG-motif cell wall-anchored protein
VGDTDQLVTDADGNARVLRLDAANGWAGSFLIPLAGKDDLLSNYGYSIREVMLGDRGQAAVLENDGETLVYIAKAVEAGKTISINHNAYQVSYEQSGDGWTVTNVRAVELPVTGGMGTTAFYVLGAILTLAALVLLITGKRMNGIF